MSNDRKRFEMTEWRYLLVEDLEDNWNRADIEIQCLQDELQKSAADERLAAELVDKLKQQLADAPTWGDWVDATLENLTEAATGVYEVEYKNKGKHLVSKREHNSQWVAMNGEIIPTEELVEIDIIKFRRLNYEPQPAREVEKTYNHFGRQIPLQKFADDETWCPSIRELAADFIAEKAKLAAAQAELWELKGSAAHKRQGENDGEV